jgi:predicted RNA-binding Zn-ribbon protein involved in translation (DUF1610 family)
MPRNFDSDQVARGEPSRLRFTEFVDCPQCGQLSEGEFFDDSMSVEDIVDPPTGNHVCPGCGHRWSSELTGWTFFSEAG